MSRGSHRATRSARPAIRWERRAVIVAVLAAGLGMVAIAAGARSAPLAGNRLRLFTGHERATKLCTRLEVRTLFFAFVQAFNRGDLRRLNRLFAREPDFQWYSTEAPGQRFNSEAKDRSSLIPYFAERHALGERLTVRSFQKNAGDNFEYGLVRSADDLQPTSYDGKGATRCSTTRAATIIVWSMGRQ